MYPYINGKQKRIDKEEIREIFKNVYALSLSKFAYVVNSSTDNIIITKFVGLAANGIFSNYSLIVSSVTTGIGIISTSLVAGIGNLNALENKEKKEAFFEHLQFFYFWLYGMLFIGMYCLINPFIEIIWGRENCLPKLEVISILLNFLTSGLLGALVDYRNACGVYWEKRYVPFVSAIVNIVLSLLFAAYFNWGIMGILLATTISRVLVAFPYYSYIVYKRVFEKRPWKNMIRLTFLLLGILVTAGMTSCFCDFFDVTGVLGLLIKFCICVIFPSAIFLLLFWKNGNFKYWFSFLGNFIRRKKSFE